MAKSTDFGSGSRSPGGWGGTGGGNAAGGMGGARSSSNYNYRTAGPGKIGNWNTGGAYRGFGNQYGVNQNDGISSGPIRPALGAQGMPTPFVPPPPVANPVVAALTKRRPPPVTQEDQPYTGALPGEPSYTPQRYINPGASVDPNGIGRTYSNISVPRGYATSNPAVYSPAGSPGGLSSYRNMGRAMQSGATPQRYGPEGVKSW